jgi:hypothetical protein
LQFFFVYNETMHELFFVKIFELMRNIFFAFLLLTVRDCLRRLCGEDKSCFASPAATRIRKSKPGVCILMLTLLTYYLLPTAVFAADSLSLTITPPLFQITQSPGTDWNSMLRIVNSNSYDLVVSASATDFHPSGETGNAVLEETPPADPADTHRMSGWIRLPLGAITIPRGKTADIPFSIHVPINADPGGHYAAIMVGTAFGAKQQGGGSSVSSKVTSLIFFRVPGEVIEEGVIRDFFAEERMVQTPDASFSLRFENKGNVHILPQGNIIITNMWGKERGKIVINEETTFGNVLPQSTRKFAFNWHGESNPLEFGRYSAEATLVYGDDGRKSVFRTAYFWVIPWKPVLLTLGGIISFFWFISWSLRRYIRKALALERARLGIPYDQPIAPKNKEANIPTAKTPAVTFDVLRRPLVEGALNLRESVAAPTSKSREQKEHSQFTLYIEWVKRYRQFFFFLFVLILGCSLIGWYFVEVFQAERAYQVKEVREGSQ